LSEAFIALLLRKKIFLRLTEVSSSFFDRPGFRETSLIVGVPLVASPAKRVLLIGEKEVRSPFNHVSLQDVCFLVSRYHPPMFAMTLGRGADVLLR